MAILTDALSRAGQTEASAALRCDPLLNHNFLVSLIDTSPQASFSFALNTLNSLVDLAVGGFSECSGLEMTMRTEDYKEGGNNGAALRFANRIEWSAITLRKGVGSSSALWDWHYGFVVGTGKRRDGVIVLMNEQRLPNTVWFFGRGLPTRYSGPQLNASQNNVAIESIEISHEGIYQVPFTGTVRGAGAALGRAGGAATQAAGALGAFANF